MSSFFFALAALGSSLLFIGGVLLLVGGGWLLARALAEVERARSHRISADAQYETVSAAREAIDDLEERGLGSREFVAPNDAEFVESLLAQRRAQGEEPDITTMGNEHIEETSPIPADEMYVPSRGL